MKAVKLDPAERHASVFAFGRELLQFSSANGRQFWQRYYDTPPMPRPNTAMMSTTGISLVKQMAEGKVGFSATTVRGDYQAPTVAMPKSDVGAGERTLKEQATEDEAPTEIQTSQGVPERISTPVNWVWSDSQEGIPLSAAPQVGAPPFKRHRYWIAAFAAAALLAVVGAAVVNRPARRSAPVEFLPAPSPVMATPPAAFGAPFVATPSKAVPPTNVSGTSAVAATVVPAPSAKPDKNEPPTKKAHHHRSHEPAAQANVGATRDPDGNLVPPP